jgi:hypothetical protein
MSERAPAFFERDAVPSITTANTAVALTADACCHFSRTSANRWWRVEVRRCALLMAGYSAESLTKIGSGQLTQQSQEEVARITRRAWGKQ